MGSSIFSWVYVSIFAATYLHVVRGYVLSTSCNPYAEDIASALKDAVKSHTLAYYSLITPETQRADWFGLMSTIFPGVMDTLATEGYYGLGSSAQAAIPPLPAALASHQVPDSSSSDRLFWNPDVVELVNTYNRAKSFSTERWETTERAREYEEWHDEDYIATNTVTYPVTYNVFFSCDARTFHQTSDNMWYDTDTEQFYDIMTDDVLCDYDTKYRLAVHPNQLRFVVVLCPAILTQRVGEPKMFATMDGTELTHTRPAPDDDTDDGLPNVTAAEFLDLQFWAGMHIDQLRERVLSVYMGRIILSLTDQKFYNEVYVTSPPNSQTFAQCKKLPFATAIRNMDSLSIYSTGASLYYNEVSRGVFDSTYDDIWKSQQSHRWDIEGNLYYNDIPRVCVTLPDEERPRCLVEIEVHGGPSVDDYPEFYSQLEPYYEYHDGGGTWVRVGPGRWSVSNIEGSS